MSWLGERPPPTHQPRDQKWLDIQQDFYRRNHQLVMHLMSDVADAWNATLAQPGLLERLLPLPGKAGRYYKIERDSARLTRTRLVDRDYSDDFLLGFCALYLWVGSAAARPDPQFGVDSHCLSKPGEECGYFRVSMDGESSTFKIYDSRGTRQHWYDGEGPAPAIDSIASLQARIAYAWAQGLFMKLR